MNNCEHTHHHDMEFNQCIHMHKVEPIKCGTDENCDIHMVAATESFATAGSSVWTLVKKIGCMIENAKDAILEKVNTIGEKISDINITVEGTAEAVAESETKASQRHETVVDRLNVTDETQMHLMLMTHTGEGHKPNIVKWQGGRYDFVGFENINNINYYKWLCVIDFNKHYIYSNGFSPYDIVYFKDSEGNLVATPTKFTESIVDGLAKQSDIDGLAKQTDIQLALDNLQLALQGNDTTATLTAIKSIVSNIPTATYGDALDAIQQVVDALPKTTLTATDKQEILNAIAGVTPTVDFTSVLNAISASESALSGTLSAYQTANISKMDAIQTSADAAKNAVEGLSIPSKTEIADEVAGKLPIGTPAEGQPATLFGAIAAGGGGGLTPEQWAQIAKEETSQKILAAVSLTAAQADEDWQNVKPA